MSKEEKVKKAIKGDDTSFLELIEEVKENLYRTAYAYTKNEEMALEVVQETVYKAYISINKLKEAKYFTTWITKILINNALSLVKKNNKVIYLDDNELIDTLGTSYDMKDEKIYLLDAINELEDKHKEVIILKYFNDLTISEVAKVLNYPEGTVKTYLNKGLIKLRKYMEKDVV